MSKIVFLLAFLLSFSLSFSQQKTLQAKPTEEHMVIDGNLHESSWDDAPIATDFIMYAPDNGKPISHEKRTIVKVLYDNNAVYISAIMYDDEPAKMLKEMTQRDNFGTAEHFGIFINGFNDGQQDFRFFLSAAGVQMDCVATETNGEDFTWDAIWSGQVSITDYGWIAEIKIPYAALRFSNADVQTWGINFYRELRRDRQQYTWNHINSANGNEITQTGMLEGIRNIEPPTRLFFIPYASYYLNSAPNEKAVGQLKGGLDIKYGISDAFTLDAILIPDFGQTRFDNVELNLGPFEQQFNENRPFFTEGTDLFNKGNIFYSRRIGGLPSTEIASNDPNVVVDNPLTVNLMNAIKISGRTKNGLGIGFLNVVTEKTFAETRNIVTGERDSFVVEPLANYNVLVLDQRFNKNSSVSFVNTNVTRDGNFRDANVSAAVFDLNTKANTYSLAGDFKYSYVNAFGDAEDKEGINTYLKLSETTGKYRFAVGANYISKDFDSNDLGIIYQTHYHAAYIDASYRILNPTKRFNTFQISSTLYSSFDNITGRLQQGFLSMYANGNTKKNDYVSLGFEINPLETYDFYEPRFDGRFLYLPSTFFTSFYFSSNYNRKFAIDFNPSVNFAMEEKRETWSLFLQPRYRFTDRITATLAFVFNRQNNNVGYIGNNYESETIPFDIFLAKRDRTTYSLSGGGKYSINKDMTVNLNLRYYWSYAENREYFSLTNDGHLIPADFEAEDTNFNAWNLDVAYSWWFAPGSQISVLYRNNASTLVPEINKGFSNNLSQLFRDNLQNVFSVSIRYFIDYNQAKNWF
ncbi:MAG TPA: DUF5916 domain-containing protein [Flavobacterium sp.]